MGQATLVREMIDAGIDVNLKDYDREGGICNF
jgi:hypothetical protein